MINADEQIENAAETIHRVLAGPGVAWDNISPEARQLYRRAMHAILATLTPAEDPNLVRWTPQDGPLAKALAGLPEGHKVTIRGKNWHLDGALTLQSGSGAPSEVITFIDGSLSMFNLWVGHNSILAASWLPAAPPWEGALVVVDGTNDLLWRGADGLYRSGAVGDSNASTAAEIEANWPPVTVLIDADHRYVEVPHA